MESIILERFIYYYQSALPRGAVPIALSWIDSAYRGETSITRCPNTIRHRAAIKRRYRFINICSRDRAICAQPDKLQLPLARAQLARKSTDKRRPSSASHAVRIERRTIQHAARARWIPGSVEEICAAGSTAPRTPGTPWHWPACSAETARACLHNPLVSFISSGSSRASSLSVHGILSRSHCRWWLPRQDIP